MKQIKIDNEIIKATDGSSVEPFHAYISLVLSLLREPFVSSDAKYLIIQNSFTYLQDMGYSDVEVEKYIEPLRDVVRQNIQTNSFMG